MPGPVHGNSASRVVFNLGIFTQQVIELHAMQSCILHDLTAVEPFLDFFPEHTVPTKISNFELNTKTVTIRADAMANVGFRARYM